MGLTFAAERFAFPSRAKFRQFCGQCRKTSIHENVCSNSSRCSMAPHDSGFPCAKKQQPNTKHATCKAATDRTGRRPRSNHSLMASVTLRDFASEPRPSEPRPLGSVLAVRKSAAIASFGANETKCAGSWRTMLFLKINKAHTATIRAATVRERSCCQEKRRHRQLRCQRNEVRWFLAHDAVLKNKQSAQRDQRHHRK